MQYSNVQKQQIDTHVSRKAGVVQTDAFRPEIRVVDANGTDEKHVDTRPRKLVMSEIKTKSTMRSWAETQTLAERAARGAEVPFAQSAWFGAAAARHLAADRNADELSFVLSAPDALIKLSVAIERAIEKASMGVAEHHIHETPVDLVYSYVESMPCSADVKPDASGLVVRIDLSEPTKRDRPACVSVPDTLWARMEQLARLSLVPNSAASRDKEAGADLMKFD
ncbi:MAG: hypothetical protein ABJQ34_05885 [Paracoccaceae bacterium]